MALSISLAAADALILHKAVLGQHAHCMAVQTPLSSVRTQKVVWRSGVTPPLYKFCCRKGGRVVAIVRGASDEAAWSRLLAGYDSGDPDLKATFAELSEGRLSVYAGEPPPPLHALCRCTDMLLIMVGEQPGLQITCRHLGPALHASPLPVLPLLLRKPVAS